MTDWLYSHKFSYKKPKGNPAKADLGKHNGLNIIKSSSIVFQVMNQLNL